jgi:hypothetical protein
MRVTSRALTVLAALPLFSACATTTTAASGGTSSGPAPEAPLELTSVTTADNTLVSFNLNVVGKLGPGVSGNELQWTAKVDSGQIGSGTAPITVAADRTFTASLPVVIAKTLQDLTPYQNTDVAEVTLNATVGGASATQTANLRSPHIPTPKILTVQGTVSSPETIDVSFLFAIDNTNLYQLELTSVDYKAYLSDKLVSDTQLPMVGHLKQAVQTEFTLPAQATPENCGKDFKAMAKSKSLPFRFTGVMHYATLDVPFDLNGTLELSREN